MGARQHKTAGFAVIAFFIAGVLLLDSVTPLSVADWVWYFIPLLLSVYVGGRFFPYVLAAVLSLLTLVGFLLSPPGIDPHLAFMSRLTGICGQWLVAFLISQRRRAEEEVRKLSHAVEQSPASIVITDRAGNIEYVNPKFEELAGYSSEEVIGKNPRILKSGETPPEEYKQMWETIVAGREWHGKFHNRKKNGELYWERASISPIFDSAGDIAHFLAIKEDITERKQAEETLAAEQRLLNSLITAIPDVIYFKDRESRFIRINAAFIQKHGLPGPSVALGKTDFDIFGEQHARQAYEDEQRIMATGQPMINQEEREDWKDGRVTWVSSTKMPLRDDAGKVVGIMGISRDISERKRAEQQLVESLDFNRKIISEAPEGILVFKASGRCVLANEAAGRTLNAMVSQLLKQDFRQIESWRVSGMLKMAEETLATKSPKRGEFHFTSTFGKEAWLACHFSFFVRGDEPHLLLLFNDIIERKQAEEHVREQASLLDKAQDAILVLDLDDRIAYWNKSAERIYGWTAAEAVGKNPVDLFLGEAISPRHAEAIRTVKERGEWSGELQEITRDGKTVTVQGRCNVICDEQGRPKARLIINTDITEKKKLEAQFLRSQRMESLGTLAGGIAHDLNNVLTPLLVSVQVLKQKISDADRQRVLESLEANVQRGASLVKQVLAFGRGVEGERIVIQPKHIAREIKQIVNETFPKSVAFELHSTPDLWTVTGDPTQLHQILLNLCVNARDAMPNGGKLSLQIENVVLDEAYASANLEARPGPHVCLTVNDTGTGISKEIQEKIFDPFFTTKEPGKGTGLGLSTTLAIVKSHGGFINCYSEPGKGCTFKVYLPANTTPGGVEKVVTGEARLLRGHNELVLVVDDEEPIRKLAQTALERYGYRVLLAANGTEAVSLYRTRRNEIDAVITDMVMPVMDGPATIAALKAVNPEVKIVGSSGFAPDGYEIEATKAGVRFFIPKPYTAETVLLTLHEVLNGNS